MTVRFEEERYSVVEGQTVELCVLADGRIDSPFTVSVSTNDITAQGESVTCTEHHPMHTEHNITGVTIHHTITM